MKQCNANIAMVQLMHCIPKPHRLLPHLNPDWYRLTRVFLAKRPLNGCSKSVVQVKMRALTVY